MLQRFVASVFLGLMVVAGAAAQEDDGRLSQEAAKQLKNPVPFTKESIAKGRIMYLRDCTECHGADGKSQVDVIANATDLTDPKYWKSGISQGEVFRSIRDGAGDSMPPFSDKFDKEDDMWHVVNFVLSRWPADARPKLVESAN
jgi:mono/diheme cytochrome c family protein